MDGLFSALSTEGERLLHEDVTLVLSEYVFRHPLQLLVALVILTLVFKVSGAAHQGELDRLRDLATRRRFLLVAAAAFGAFGLSLALDLQILGGRPHTQDEIAYLFQARTLAQGRLWIQAPGAEVAPAVRVPFTPMYEGRWFGKYWPGWPLVLAPAARLGAESLVNPLLLALAVWLFHGLLRRHWSDPWAVAGAWALALSPAVLVMGASMMSQPLALVLFLVLLEGHQRWIGGGSTRAALLVGIGCGGLVLGRPAEAMVLGVPVILSMASNSLDRFRRAPVLLALGVPVLAAAALLLTYDHALTGDAFKVPFLLEHPGDRPGFGPDRGVFEPEGHNGKKGLVQLGLNLAVLNEDLLGWPMCSLLLPALGLFGGGTDGRTRRVLLTSTILVSLLYFTFVSHGIAFGARYYFVLVPVLLWFALDGLRWLRSRLPVQKWPALVLSVAALTVLGLATYWPGRIERLRDYWNVPSFPLELALELPQGPVVVVVPSVRVAGFRDLFDGFSSLNAPWPPEGNMVFVRDGPWVTNGAVGRWLPGRPVVGLDLGRVRDFLGRFQSSGGAGAHPVR